MINFIYHLFPCPLLFIPLELAVWTMLKTHPCSLSKKSKKIITHIPGLSFSQKNRLKNLIHHLTCGILKTRSNTIIWHDIINNTITAHPSNDNTPWSTQQLISTLATHKDRLAAIIYCKCFGTSDILERHFTSGILVISPHKHLLLSDRKRNNDWYLKQIEKIHQSVKLETLLFTILKHSKHLRRLVVQKRSKTRKRKSKKRSSTARRRNKKSE